jgi:membrane protein DedA with SNARE-associated domain
MSSLESSILNFIQQAYNAIGWAGVVALMTAESACIPIPSEIIMPLAGWFLIKDAGLPVSFNLVAGLLGALGCTIGSLIAYWVGGKVGRPVLNKYGKYILITHHDLDRAEAWFKKYGEWAAFLTRLLPVVRTFISLFVGIAKMPIWKFIVYTFLGSFIWCTALSFGGYLLGAHWEDLRNTMRPFDIPIAAVIVLLIGWYIYLHIKRSKAAK